DRWGKIKIKNGLQQKNIDPATLQKALADINQDEYLQALNELLERKYKEVKSANGMEDARRILMFALSRGYEEELIQEWIEKQDFEG
ncbi:MAG: RecX family transcriptional regulator, partial [Saprospiraceae bacterium]